jgi:hypothetical protein
MWKLKNPLPFLAFAFVAVTTTWKRKKQINRLQCHSVGCASVKCWWWHAGIDLTPTSI